MAKGPGGGGGGGADSMLQGLQQVLGMLGSLMATADADPQFLTTLMHAIAAKIKQSTQQAIGPNRIGPGGGAGMAGFGGIAQQAAAGGGPPGQGAPPGGPPPGGGMPNPDELRRTVGATGMTG